MSITRGIGLAATLILTLSGCANWNGIYRTKTVATPNGPRVITIDAKQREVIMVPEPTANDRANPQNARGWRICAEASPDVFSALAASASGALKADIAGKSGELSAALAVAETAATIERTQTINLLRESFYRTCERYLSGAITKESFIVQSGRDARAMVAVLAIEQLTGAVKRPATIISGPATSARAQLASNGLTMLAAAQKRRREAQADLEAAQTQEKADCEKIQDADKKADCVAAKAAAPAAVAKANAAIDQADTEIADIKQVSAAGGANIADSSTTSGATEKGGEPTPGARSSDIQQVASTVSTITLAILQQDDMKLYCIERVEQISDATLKATCFKLLSKAAETESSVYSAQIERYRAIYDTDNSEFSRLLSNDGVRVRSFLKQFSELTPFELNQLQSNDNTTVIREFMNLSPGQRRNIIEGLKNSTN